MKKLIALLTSLFALGTASTALAGEGKECCCAEKCASAEACCCAK